MTEPLRPEVRALVLKTAIAVAEEELKAVLKGLAPAYPLPASVTFESPLDGARLGHINRARTTPEWKVTSAAQLLEHFAQEYPDALETVYVVEVPGATVTLPEDHPIVVVLAKHAPDLLAPRQQVPADTVAAALQQSRDTGEAVAPGIQLVRAAQGALSVVYDKKEAVAAIGRLVRAGLIDWTGRPVVASGQQTAVAS